MPRLRRKSGLLPRKYSQKKRQKLHVDTDLDAENEDLCALNLLTNSVHHSFCQTENFVSDNFSQTETCDEDHNYCVSADNFSQTETCDDDHNYCVSVESGDKHQEDDVLNCGFIQHISDDCDQTVDLNAAFIEADEDGYVSQATVLCLDINTASEVEVEDVKFDEFCKEVTERLVSGFQFEQKSSKLLIYQLYSEVKPTVKLSVTIYNDFTCMLTVHGQEVPKTHEIWEGLPIYFHRTSCVVNLCERISKFRVCSGNPDEEFTSLVPVGAGLANHLQETTAYHEGDFNAETKTNNVYHGTIRTVTCSLLHVSGERCKSCASYRRLLRMRRTRLQEREDSNRTFSHSTFKHKDMTRSELIKKLNEQKCEIGSLQKKVWQLKREMEKVINEKGVSLKSYENCELRDLMESCHGEFEKSFPDSNCRQRIFWDQQRQMASKADSRGMRWHPMIIKWCLLIRQKSAQAYDAMRESGFVKLPSTRTLFDYSHYLKSELGIQRDVIQCAKQEAEKNGLYSAEWRSYVGLLFDEIKVREDLVYDKHSGELVGYCNLGAVANEMLNLENSVNGRKPDIAKFVLVVMLRSTASKWCFPLCGFATNSITADFLYPIIWGAVAVVETKLKLRVLFFTCDGASPNRRFFAMHRVGNEEVVFKSLNPHDLSRHIYFISDVPHLLKTIRNNFSNSFSHKQSRMLWKNGKDISWAHIDRLFEEHCELNLYNPCPKLSRDHIDLASFNYMKVNLAAQVMSDSVAYALEELYGTEVSETVIFIRHVNKFFDCMNVRSLFEGRNKRNENLKVYESEEDQRLNYLLYDFLGYFSEWTEQVSNRPGNFTSVQKASMQLSHQTLTGLKLSVHSICSCIRFLLGKGASYVLTHTFNQDPLEQHFGHYRLRAGSNHNPSVYEVQNIMTTMRTVNAQALPPRQGNIQRGPAGFLGTDNTKLPKRKSVR